VISPVGAIVNGLEVLEDEDSAEMRDFAEQSSAERSRASRVTVVMGRSAGPADGAVG
jgi:histidine phosphotransferase ChpT